MTNEQTKLLEYPFQPDEIEWRVVSTTKDKSKGLVAAFVNSRAIQKRLDTVLGRENWQNNFRTISGNNNASTSHICEISIFYPERGEWITKSDGAGSTEIEPIKGGLSNAFKRAASMWGIGRYLYEFTDIWAILKDGKYINKTEMPRLRKEYTRFVNGYLSKLNAKNREHNSNSSPKATEQAKNTEYVQQNSNPPVSPVRFSNPVPEKDSSSNHICKITDLKVTRGGNGSQTLITLQQADGNSISGYIKGETQLKTGQHLSDLKIIKKNSPIVGDYNIIESYNIAA